MNTMRDCICSANVQIASISLLSCISVHTTVILLFARTYFDDNAFATVVVNNLFRFSALAAFLFAFALAIRLAVSFIHTVSFTTFTFTPTVRFATFITLFTFWFITTLTLFPRARRGFRSALAAFVCLVCGRVVRCL